MCSQKITGPKTTPNYVYLGSNHLVLVVTTTSCCRAVGVPIALLALQEHYQHALPGSLARNACNVG
jgi:hypothetical protein